MNSIKSGVLCDYETIEASGVDPAWIIMVHGASQHRGVFSAQVESFRDKYRLLLIDLPGHGRSAAVPGPYGMAEYAERVDDVIERVIPGAAHYWGTHTGAAVGLLLASSDRARRFKSLILDGAVIPGVDLPSVTAAISRAKASARTRGIEAARREWFDQADWFKVMRENPEQCRCAEHWSMISEFPGGPWLDTSEPRAVASIEPRLRELDLPVLLVNGEHDLADFRMVAERLAKTLPHARQFVVPGGGGFPLWEYPHAVNACVSDFLGRLNTR